MPQLIITINAPLVDSDGQDHRMRKEIDLMDRLNAGQQTAVAAMMSRIQAAVLRRYGASAVIEGMRFVPDSPWIDPEVIP